MTKQGFINDISTEIDNAVANSSTLSNDEEATILQAVIDYISNHCASINPNVKETPHIKFRT